MARRAQAGERRAFEALVSRYQPRLMGLMRRHVPDHQEAEDLVQETFLRVYERLSQYRPERPFRPWLFTIGVRLAITRHRRRRDTPAEADSLAALPSREPEPFERSERADHHQRLWRLARAVLTPEQHTMLWLRYVEDMPIAEVAAVTGRSRLAVRVGLHRARRRLAETLVDPDAMTSAPGSETSALAPGSMR